MHVPLGHRDAGMSRQLHDCKCIRSRFTQSGEGTAEGVALDCLGLAIAGKASKNEAGGRTLIAKADPEAFLRQSSAQ